MSDELETRVKQLAADVLNLPLARISAATSPQNVEGWDSVQHLNLVLALEDEFKIQLDPEDIDVMRSIGDIIAVTRSKVKSGQG